MLKIVAEKLQVGDEVRIVAPSTGLKIIGEDCRQLAQQRFEEMGLKVSFGKNTIDANWDAFGSSSVRQRAEDLMDAFSDKKVKAIFSIIGGFNSNQILPYLGYEIIKKILKSCVAFRILRHC